MTGSSQSSWVRIRPLGGAWKVRVSSQDAAEHLRSALVSAGWKCTPVTAAFDDVSTVLFRATDSGGDRDRELAPSVGTVPGIDLHGEPA